MKRKKAQLGNSAYTGLGDLALFRGLIFVYYQPMNAGRKPVFVLDQDCIAVTDRIIQEVEKAGMQAMRSFDLRSVKSSGKGFCCPVHGTSSCTCQLVILLIFLPQRGCARVILEGSDQKTSVFLDAGLDDSDEPIDLTLTSTLTQAFFH